MLAIASPVDSGARPQTARAASCGPYYAGQFAQIARRGWSRTKWRDPSPLTNSERRRLDIRQRCAASSSVRRKMRRIRRADKRRLGRYADQRFRTCSPNDCRLWAQRQLPAHDRGEFDCLNSLWDRESRWKRTANNPASGAHGIPQALPGSKMGPGWESDAKVQIGWGLGYVDDTYGGPCAAWRHELAAGSY